MSKRQRCRQLCNGEHRLTSEGARLALADGSLWTIAGGDSYSARVVSTLARIARAEPLGGDAATLLVVEHSPQEPPGPGSPEFFILDPSVAREDLGQHAILVLHAVVREAQSRGGMLLHGALAERAGEGVVIAGKSKAGKTTASRRLRRPWRSLCDDTTLALRDANGSWRAHPWPTLADIPPGGGEESWDVQHASSLRALFFLEQSTREECRPVGEGEALCMLTELSEQVSWPLHFSLGGREGVAREERLQRFENLSRFVKEVPCYRLAAIRDGEFWQAMDAVLDGKPHTP